MVIKEKIVVEYGMGWTDYQDSGLGYQSGYTMEDEYDEEEIRMTPQGNQLYRLFTHSGIWDKAAKVKRPSSWNLFLTSVHSLG